MAIANIINPEVLGQIVNEKLANLIPNLPATYTTTEFSIGNPGTSWEIPYNKKLTALTRDGEGVTLVPQNLGQDRYKMVVQRAGQAYKAPDIDEMVSKFSPKGIFQGEAQNRMIDEFTGNIAGTVYDYIFDRMIDLFEGSIPSANRYAPGAVASKTTIQAAKMKLGDKASKLKYVLMNSTDFDKLDTAGHVVYQPANNIVPISVAQTSTIGIDPKANMVPTVAGMIIVQTDKIGALSSSPVTRPIYLLGDGALGFYYQRNLTIEYAREALIGGGYDVVIPRVDFVHTLHGVSYTESTSPQVYTSAAIKNTSNYTLKWNHKEVNAVRLLVTS
jgi:hypothetical protein